nr:hypothetical protein [Halogranum amylolyticum]
MPLIESTLLVEQLKNAVLHPTERVFLALILPLEDVTLREVFSRADEQSLFDEEITRVLFSDTDKVCHEVSNETEFLNAVVPLASDIDHAERVAIGTAVEPVNYEIQPTNWFSVVVSEYEIRALVLVGWCELAECVENLLVIRE